MIIDNMFIEFKRKSLSFISNSGPSLNDRTFPLGFDVERFSFIKLSYKHEFGLKNYCREHVKPYHYENSNENHFYKSYTDKSFFRLTIDTSKIFQLIEVIYNNLYLKKIRYDFFFSENYSFNDKSIHLIEINKHIQ